MVITESGGITIAHGETDSYMQALEGVDLTAAGVFIFQVTDRAGQVVLAMSTNNGCEYDATEQRMKITFTAMPLVPGSYTYRAEHTGSTVRASNSFIVTPDQGYQGVTTL